MSEICELSSPVAPIVISTNLDRRNEGEICQEQTESKFAR